MSSGTSSGSNRSNRSQSVPQMDAESKEEYSDDRDEYFHISCSGAQQQQQQQRKIPFGRQCSTATGLSRAIEGTWHGAAAG